MCTQEEGGELQKGVVKVVLPSATSAMNGRQLEWLRTFMRRLQAMQPAKTGQSRLFWPFPEECTALCALSGAKARQFTGILPYILCL